MVKDQSDKARSERLRIALDLADSGIQMYRQRLRRTYPGESEAQISQRLSKWLADRPPDSPGRPIDPSTILGS